MFKRLWNKITGNTFAFMSMAILVGLITGLLMTQFVLFKSEVSGNSMLPNYTDGQEVWVSRLGEPTTGDVVVLLLESQNKYLIKRLVGVPGDTLYIEGDKLYRNGEYVDEPYAIINPLNYPKGLLESPYHLNEDEYFVLGDNRAVSNDSRYFGVVKKRDILGVVLKW